MQENTSFANLTENELIKIREAEIFLNKQLDDKTDRQEGKEIILLAYMYDKS
jgi:hypothetical protein